MLVASANVILRREVPKPALSAIEGPALSAIEGNLVIGRGIVFRERDSSRPAGAQNDRLSSYQSSRFGEALNPELGTLNLEP